MKGKFEVNEIYSVRTDNYYFGKTCGDFKGYIYTDYKCVKRTKKTVSFNHPSGCVSKDLTYRINLDDNGNEYIYMKNERIILTAKD